jgi:hypothetical protein
MQKNTPLKTCDILKYHKLPQTLDMYMIYKLLIQNGQNLFVLKSTRPISSTERLHMVYKVG